MQLEHNSISRLSSDISLSNSIPDRDLGLSITAITESRCYLCPRALSSSNLQMAASSVLINSVELLSSYYYNEY
jgi:hypothetical protein